MAVEIKTNLNMDSFSFEWRLRRKGIRRKNNAKEPKSRRFQRAGAWPRVPQTRGVRCGGVCTRAIPPSSGAVSAVEKRKSGGKVAQKRKVKGKGLKVGSANVGSMSEKDGEVADMLRKHDLDFCALQETRWKGSGAKMIEGYKFFWQGGRGGAGVGLMVAEKWVDCVLEVKRVNDRIIVVRVNVGIWVLNLVSVYAPQVGRPMVEKENFYMVLGKTLTDLGGRNGEIAVICGDFNGHVGERIEGYEGIHGGKGFGKRNPEGEMLLEFAGAHRLAIMNTWFDKNDLRKISYDSGGNQTVVDYILIDQRERSSVSDVTIIRNEPCLLQHKLLVCRLVVRDWVPSKIKQVFVKKTKIYKLKKESVLQEFQKGVSDKARNRSAETTDVDTVWNELKSCLLDTAKEVCGESKGPSRHKETWWWNDECNQVVEEKRKLFVVMKESEKGEDRQKAEVDKVAYKQAKRRAKTVIGKAKESESKRWCESVEASHRKGEVFRVVKQMKKRNRDVTGAGCIRNASGKLVMEESELREVWRKHYEKLSNEEFDWDKDSLGEKRVISGPIQEISKQEVRLAVAKMKCNKAPGPTGVAAELLKGAGEDGIDWLTDICNAIVKEGQMPNDWNKSYMINVYKGKGDALECGSYRGIKLLEHPMKVFERVMETRLRQVLCIDEMQFGFTPGRGTTDAVFILRQLQERYLVKKRDLWMAFVDLEKAFDRVPRDVIWWALRELGVEEHTVSVIQTMYSKASTAVKLGDGESGDFEVKVGVHQGSVLSPLLFIAVLEAISRRFDKQGLPFELLYADDLVIMAETREALIEKIRMWKQGMESMGLRVNMAKTKVLKCRAESGSCISSGKWPCGVCKKGVGSNSILCNKCTKWIHKKCSGVKGKLTPDPEFQCKNCVSGVQNDQRVEDRVMDLGEDGSLEMVQQFCYLGDMIGAGGGSEEAVRCRIRCAWAKFNELAPMLTKRGLSLKMKGDLYVLYVRTVLVHGSETWAMKVGDMQRMIRTERSMIRQMCRVSLKDKRRSVDLLKLMGIIGVEEIMDSSALRWFGHVERKEDLDWVSLCRGLEVEGEVGRGRGMNTWGGRLDKLMKKKDLQVEMTADRVVWRHGCAPTRSTRPGVQTRASSRM
jgi:hypothetical protein